ncbi:SDR family oxidoreductase [Moorena sp. SIO3I8]|uniref:SDR family oxidoreductase n=1 Tax=Moorena sp. SIO3I8 TaxID=2607833 RepID=UPI0013BFF90E|nr:SDR family oxidoreductase [Moorena sp. SIO3I8]NEO09751.1 SDR family NAD(P)-dependent oxidoreductase [Moorena sp. SIO3I8]
MQPDITKYIGQDNDNIIEKPIQDYLPQLLTKIESALLANSLVDDCVVLESKITEEKKKIALRDNCSFLPIIAYVVSAGSSSSEQLRSLLQGVVSDTISDTLLSSGEPKFGEPKVPPNFSPNIIIVPVTTLPLTPTGEIDQQALASVEIIDTDLVQQWEEQLQSYSYGGAEIKQVAVVLQDYTQPDTPLHLLDLLPPSTETSPKQPTELSQAKPLPSPYPKASSDCVPVATQGEHRSNSTPSKPAISHGEALQLPTDISTLSQALLKTARVAPEQGIIYLDSDSQGNTHQNYQSYPALLEEAQQILGGLRKLNLKPQDKVIFQFDQNQDFIPTFWACILGGFVPVPIAIAPTYESSNSTVNKLCNAWKMLEQPVILTSDTLAPAIRGLCFPVAAPTEHPLPKKEILIETVDNLRSSEPDLNYYHSQPDDLAILLLTSGSTGMPKGVRLSHSNLINNVAASAQRNNLTQDDISLNWLNLDHVGSLVRCCIRDVYVGNLQIHAPAKAFLENPLNWLDWIENYRVTFAWAPNFALGLINQKINQKSVANSHRKWDLSSLKSVLSVAEPIVPQTAKRFLQLLSPHGLSVNAMHSAWGMSETCAAVVFSHRYLLNLPSDNQSVNHSVVEVGRPVPGFSVRIVDALGQIVEEDTVGQVQISGPMVSDGYYQNPELNREAFTPDGWLKTGDNGVLRDGRLTITGREKDVIIINGLNHYSYEIEAVVEQVEGVIPSYTAACGIRQPSKDTDQLVIFFHTDWSEDDQLTPLLQDISTEVVSKLGVSPSYLIPLPKQAIPKSSIGKILRSQLKEQFNAGEFDPILKKVDCLLGNENTLPDWFYRKVWHRKEAVTLGRTPTNGRTLIFLDSLGLGEVLCSKLGKDQCVAVEPGAPGADFLRLTGAQLTDAQLTDNRYSIDPTNPDHYQQLLKSLVETDQPIAQILHLWTYDEYPGEIESSEALEQAQNQGTYSLLFLIQALDGLKSQLNSPLRILNSEVQLTVVSSYTQPTSPQDDIAYEKSPILGLIKTCPRELPWLNCRHIDIPVDDHHINGFHILREMAVCQKEREVAYRNRNRLVPLLEKADLPQLEKQELPFKQKGMYLISGGLGGIGVEIAKFLLNHYQARLLLVGRTPLPEPTTKGNHLKDGNGLAPAVRAYQNLEQLAEQLGGEIRYEAVDICDLAQLQQVVERAQSDWQAFLEGVIHLAGIAPEHFLVEETRNSFAATLRPKLLGSWVLHQLIKDQPDSVFISLSSVLAFFGGATIGAYAAANNFLECFCYYQRHKTLVRSYCYGSSTWVETTLNRSKQIRESRRALGQYGIFNQQGINSILAGLHHDQHSLILGLDGSNPYVRRYTQQPPYHRQRVSVYFTAVTELSVAQLQRLEAFVPFGTSITPKFQQLQAMPLTPAGEIDREQLISPSKDTENVLPVTDIERQLASIWQKVLGVSQIGIDDNFFGLGGNSLLAVQLSSEIEKTFGKQLPLAALFQAPTIKQLAQLLCQSEWSSSWFSLVPIQPSGSKPVVFAIHILGEGFIYYRDLVRYLGWDYPVYGLSYGLAAATKADNINTKPGIGNGLKELAAHYIEEMRRFQPEGPYFLQGVSLGGQIAFEMAKQLDAQGQTVAIVALFDSYAIGYQWKPYENTTVLQRYTLFWIQKLQTYWNNLWRLEPHKRRAYLSERIRAFVRHYKSGAYKRQFQWFAKKSNLSTEPALPNPNLVDGISDIQNANYETQPSELSSVYPGKITLFRAKQQPPGHYHDPLNGWDGMAASGIEVHHIPGDHISMMLEPNVRVLAEKLKACLDKL